jgi:dipeptidyl aminopeptidase/acylaminoacyl peptidase
VWSPDGGKIAFRSRHDNGFTQVWVMNADGSNPTRLTAESLGSGEAAWSPDGTKIAYSADSGDIYVVSAYGTNRTRLTNLGTDSHAAWSPDGTKIAFNRMLTANNRKIFVMNANGSNQTQITNTSASDNAPEWQRIAVAPSPTPAQAINLSTRMRVQTGDNVGIAGFIITGSAPKQVLVRALGPSLTQLGVTGAVANPFLELHGPGAFATITNDNWRDDPAQEPAITATGLAPGDNLESVIAATLAPGNYTAVVRGMNNTSGVALAEVYDLDPSALSKLGNISTRAFVGTDNDIVIAGFILGNESGNDRIIVRGLGPSLTGAGVPNALPNPKLELRDQNGALLQANNDWQDDPAQAAELTAAGLALTNPLESGLVATLSPGAYTALLLGVNNGTGNGLVEVYDRVIP